jgi:hypothetical protein
LSKSGKVVEDLGNQRDSLQMSFLSITLTSKHKKKILKMLSPNLERLSTVTSQSKTEEKEGKN